VSERKKIKVIMSKEDHALNLLFFYSTTLNSKGFISYPRVAGSKPSKIAVVAYY